MPETQSTQVEKLEKLRAAWLPAVEFLFGEAVENAHFEGFDVLESIAKPTMVIKDITKPCHYTIQIPERSFTNDVMLFADVIQEMVRGLYPVASKDVKIPALCEGVAVFGAITAIRQVFGDEVVDSYLNALKEKAFAYYDAFSYTAVLLAEDPEAIKKLRNVQPFLYKLSRSDFDMANVDIDRKIKDILLLEFRL